VAGTAGKVRKAVIPAAGLGTRFLPATKAQPKEMLPIVDKPAIQYVIEEAVAAGIDDILVITGRNKKSIEDHFDRAVELESELEAKGKNDMLKEVRALTELAHVHFVRQPEPKGLGHAVGMARHHVGDEPFAVMLPDDLFVEPVLQRMVESHEKTGRSVLSLLEVPTEKIAALGSAGFDPYDGSLVKVTQLVEKPPPGEELSNYAVVGRYVLTPDIFEAIDRVPPGRGNEIQLTDAIAVLAEESEVYGWQFSTGRYDTGNKIDFLQATVELALARDDLGPEFRAYLQQLLG
jgi:UTP--glucose-1-phosphate uridylyltransferase